MKLKMLIALFLGVMSASASASAVAGEGEIEFLFSEGIGKSQNGQIAAAALIAVSPTQTLKIGNAEVRPLGGIKIGTIGAQEVVGAEFQGLVRFNSNPSVVFVPSFSNTSRGVEAGFAVGTEVGQSTLVKFGMTKLEFETAGSNLIYQVSFLRPF